MSTASKHLDENSGPIQQRIQYVMDHLEMLLGKLEKNDDYTPLQDEVDGSAREIISIVNQYHDKLVKFESYLKNAIIDLTEVPYMQPQMQKIAFQVALKAALKNLQSFLDHTPSM